LKTDLGVHPVLVRGSGGIFVVEVNGQIVARKTPERGFPDESEILTAVRAALDAPTPTES
jgi:predicted Rdx family selenoprotein